LTEALILKKNPLLLEEGEMVSCSGFILDNHGVLKCRPARNKVNTTILGSINSIHRYMNWVLAADGSLHYKWDLNGYCDLYTPTNGDFTTVGTLLNTNKLSFADYNEFIFMVNGQDKKAFTKGNFYKWGVDNPVSAPIGTASGDPDSGNPDGVYTLYYTYYIMFANGRIYETAPSPAGTVTVDKQAIAWSGIGICPYSGNDLIIYRKLYRTSTTLGEIYYVGTKTNNTGTTDTDNVSDSDLLTNAIISTENYSTPPTNAIDIETYLQRIFAIKGNSLYWSEAYIPFAFLTSSSVVISTEGDELIAVIQWGDQLYLASKTRWFRLQGSDPDTWAIKQTFVDNGIINRHTVKKTKYGILGLWYDGIYLFDGSISKNMTEKTLGLSFFTDLTDFSVCWAEFDGKKYYLHYASTGSTVDKCLILDFSEYPNIKSYNEDFIASAYELSVPTGIKYFAKSDGYQYEETGNETIVTSLRAGDKAFENVLKQKNALYLYYDVNTNSKDLTATVYVDDVSKQTLTINTSSRERKRLQLGQYEGYRYSLGLSCADSQSLEVYAPWAIEATPVGV
jgi:hypothetical protein